MSSTRPPPGTRPRLSKSGIRCCGCSSPVRSLCDCQIKPFPAIVPEYFHYYGCTVLPIPFNYQCPCKAALNEEQFPTMLAQLCSTRTHLISIFPFILDDVVLQVLGPFVRPLQVHRCGRHLRYRHVCRCRGQSCKTNTNDGRIPQLFHEPSISSSTSVRPTIANNICKFPPIPARGPIHQQQSRNKMENGMTYLGLGQKWWLRWCRVLMRQCSCSSRSAGCSPGPRCCVR